jgi:hypothetical protein
MRAFDGSRKGHSDEEYEPASGYRSFARLRRKSRRLPLPSSSSTLSSMSSASSSSVSAEAAPVSPSPLFPRRFKSPYVKGYKGPIVNVPSDQSDDSDEEEPASGPKCNVCQQGKRAAGELFSCQDCKVTAHGPCYSFVPSTSGGLKCILCANKTQPINKDCVVCGQAGGAMTFAKEEGSKQASGIRSVVHRLCCDFVGGTASTVSVLPAQTKKNANMGPCACCSFQSGWTAKCFVEDCRTAFHPTCARDTKRGILLRPGNHPFRPTFEAYFEERVVCCRRHEDEIGPNGVIDFSNMFFP